MWFLYRMLQLAEDLDPQGTKVVLLKVHLEAAPDHDLVSSMQALAIEAMEAGYHFYILLQVRFQICKTPAEACLELYQRPAEEQRSGPRLQCLRSQQSVAAHSIILLICC